MVHSNAADTDQKKNPREISNIPLKARPTSSSPAAPSRMCSTLRCSRSLPEEVAERSQFTALCCFQYLQIYNVSNNAFWALWIPLCQCSLQADSPHLIF